ncbi:MAG: B12-binding domain-containing protein [Acidimicrobiia bacterium]
MTTTPPEADSLTLQQVADEFDVHYMTAYRWVRLGMLNATKVGRSWVVTREDLEAYKAGSQEPRDRGTAPWDERLLNRMLAADDSGSWAVVESALTSGMSVQDVYTRMVVPALRSVGDQWEAGAIGIAEEHAASTIAYRIVARLGPRAAPRGVRRGTIVLGSTATELHSLPLSIAADLFRSQRFEVIDLGANLPPAAFADRVRSTDGLVAIAIGVTTPGQEAEISHTVSALREVSDAPILVGGSGARDVEATSVGADATAVSADDALTAIEAILESR